MKASGSPCPLDQISIIVFKRCPYLRSYLQLVFKKISSSGQIRSMWKKAVTILIHKKGEQNDAQNFRPITLGTVPLKIYTSFPRNRMYSFLNKNGYIESTIQKGFTLGMAGTFEHTSHMSYLINQARAKQRSIVITLLYVKNAFCEVHHNLITDVLSHHHIPPEIREIVKHLYANFFTCVSKSEYTTEFIHFGRGVLQGDCISPLLFNLIINTFIRHIKQKEYEQLGYKFSKCFSPRHWYQSADDASVITGQEYEAQILLNAFTKWYTWSNMIIRVDKCKTFGITKRGSNAVQTQPKLFSGELRPGSKPSSFAYVKTVNISVSSCSE